MANISQKVLEVISQRKDAVVGITGSPSTTLDITIDIKEESKAERALGQMVYVVIEEDGRKVLAIGQIIAITTNNRWHEAPEFKGVIKRHGRLPHLSGTADNRVATISVQACYDLSKEFPEGYILGTSPSTGEQVERMNNEVMETLIKEHDGYVTYIGTVYGTNVNLPFWFKHFGEDDIENKEKGAGDAYHIGVFGRTGSGKTVTASYMLLGYAKNRHNLSILVLDPQRQFYLDNKLLPQGKKLEDAIKAAGMNYEKREIVKDVYLPGKEVNLFSELLLATGFIQEAFKPIYTPDKLEAMRDSVSEYLSGRCANPRFDLNTCKHEDLLLEILRRFSEPSDDRERERCEGFSKYIYGVWGTTTTRQRLKDRIDGLLEVEHMDPRVLEKWQAACKYFEKSTGKISVDDVVQKIVHQNGNFLVLDISGKSGGIENDNIQALFVKVIENKIVDAGEELYNKGLPANCLVVLDEAHRFISTDSPDPRVRDLTKDIIAAVRTTRKYSIGYMFITQTVESLHDEILRQMRIFAFGYGLTSGPELKKVSEIVNNKAAIQLYQSFIDPSSNKKFPFMFFGPISPLSFTGSPLFLEVYTDFTKFK